MELIRGAVPPEFSGSGSGYGDGDGYGYGYGSGYGDGDGYGYGYGYGDGSGYGYGDDIAACSPCDFAVDASMLHARKACADQVATFERVFPDGAVWPRDADKARAAGLDLGWARKNLGLLEPK